MATQLDLQEQEQLDELKAFWKQYGNLVTWTVVVALAAYAGWSGWNYWQRDQGLKAGAMYDALDQAAQAGNAERVGQIFSDLRQRYGGTAFAEQGGLLAAKVQFDKNQVDAAKASLGWVAENAKETQYRDIAHLRLAGLLADAGKYDAALAQVDAVKDGDFAALAADRRGDVLFREGRKDQARAAYQAAWKAMDPKLDYRHLIDAKLTALGAAPDAAASAASGASR
ncbi:MAG: tetratricopeptide repeat protein [Burkholderiales bacterium]|nr:tetratricopeptide repeat protein [Burkholderiales bacterium]MDE2453527.1 tetratricopeptide repeat protein [Burkholderiales bacterium]